MKKYILLIATALMAVSISAADLTGKRIYINPGHGSFGPNDRPRATIPYPNLSSTGMPDTCGFYETNTNLWKCLYLGKKLEAAGATVFYSRTANGPWPYEKVNGQYPDYTYEKYKALPDYEKYNRNLTEICEEVESNNIDCFISVHSNAATDGTTINYPLVLYRGYDNITTTSETVDGVECNTYVTGSRERAEAIWQYRFGIMASGIDPASNYSIDMKNVRGDLSFYAGSSVRTDPKTDKAYKGYLGVLKHGAPGFLVEGYFHTYQPARHRALNHDYCHQEGLAYYRGIVDYYGADKETTGYIMGTVKDLHRKMNNPLFNYAPKTNDQWIPCNGAEVTLLKGGVEVAKYNVDTLYNGIFVFENLTPGDDYTLDATCKGYEPLTDDQKATFSVKANETTYKMIYLEDTAYVPPTVVYYNYPEPEQPAYLQLAGTYEMKKSFAGKKLADVLVGKTVRRVLYRNGNMYILAVDAAKEPTLIEVDAEKQTVLHTLPTDFCSVVSADGYKLSDITFTADGYLVGCNYEHTAFDASYAAKYGEGSYNYWNLYKWESDATGWKGALWLTDRTAVTSGNFYNAMMGSTLTYSGTLTDGLLIAPAITTGSSKETRIAIYSIADGAKAGGLYNKVAGKFKSSEYGAAQFVVSPRDDKNIIITSAKKAPIECALVMTTNTEITPVGTFAAHTTGANYFKYAHRDMMVAPAEDADGKNIGVALYDITDGLDKAALIKTTNTTLDAADATYTMAAGVVKDADITLYLVRDSLISKFTTVGVDQPAVASIMAYNLNVVESGDNYVFSFNANSDAVSANLIFYAADNTEVGAVELANVVKGANTFTIAKDELPGDVGATMTWAVELQGQPISNIGILYKATSKSLSLTRPFISINNSPESEYFQYLYLMDRVGSSKANSGLYAFKPDYTRINTTPYKGGRAMYGSPYRTFVDDQGYIWISDGSDGYSNVIVADPANLENGKYEEFFQGTRDKNGIITNNGVEVGSSSLGISIYGTGKETKLLSLNEDGGTSLVANSITIYNIGTEEGTYKHSWNEAPSAVIKTQGIVYDGYPLGCTHGIWVASRRAAGQNNTGYTALKFYDWEGNEHMNSAKDPYQDIIDGGYSGACALSKDESVLYFIDGSKHIMVWDIVWEGNKPIMTLRYMFDCGLSSIREMHLDYAGNLVCSGEDAVAVFSLPKTDNTTIIPARKALTVSKSGTGTHVDEVTTPAPLDMSAPMYDILGRQVDNTYKGIVIQNGKKYLLQ